MRQGNRSAGHRSGRRRSAMGSSPAHRHHNSHPPTPCVFSGPGYARGRSNRSPNARSIYAPSPRQAEPCRQAKVVGRVAANRSIIAAAFQVCVLQHRRGTHPSVCVNGLIFRCGFRFRWGPDRRRWGSHQDAPFRRLISLLDQIWKGSHVGAGSQPYITRENATTRCSHSKPVENPWSRAGGLGGKSHMFAKGLVGATGIEPVTPPV